MPPFQGMDASNFKLAHPFWPYAGIAYAWAGGPSGRSPLLWWEGAGGEGGLGWELLVRRGFPYLGWCCRRQVLGWLGLRAWIGESLDSFVVPGIRLPLPPSKEGVCVPVILLTSASSEGPGRVLYLSYPRVTGFIAILILTIPRGVFTFAFLGGGLRTYV